MDYLQTNKGVFNYKYYKNAKSFYHNRIKNVVSYSDLTLDSFLNIFYKLFLIFLI